MTTALGPPRRDKPKCGGKLRGGREGTCARPAGWGTTHPRLGRCKLHGGATPNHQRAAELELARRAVATYGLPREVDPHDALLEEVHRTAGHVAWLTGQIQALDPEALVWGKTEEVNKGAGEFTGVDITHAAVPPVWLELYHRERRHLVDVCKAAIAAGVEERRIRLAERQGQEMAGVFRRVLDALSLTAEQRALVPRLLEREIAVITGQAKIIEGAGVRADA